MKLAERISRRIDRPDDGAELSFDDRFPECAALGRRYVVQQRNWYRRRARNIRRLFRVFGGGVIVLGAALPVLAFLEFDGFRLVITIVSVAIGALTALRSFFQWDKQWRVLKIADWELTALLASWEADLCALAVGDENHAGPAAFERTQALLKETEEVVRRESTSFFSEMRWPETERSRGNDSRDEHPRDR